MSLPVPFSPQPGTAVDNSPAAYEARKAEHTRVGAEAEAAAANRPPAPTVNAQHAAFIAEAQAWTDATTGRRLYVDNDKFRNALEVLRAKVYRGEDVSHEIAAARAKREGKPAPTPAWQPDPNAAPPVGSPSERIADRLEAGEVLGLAELGAAATSGYKLDHLLGDQFGLSEQDVIDLAAARRAGLSQAQIEAIVRERIRTAI
jgi:hypothetical protein